MLDSHTSPMSVVTKSYLFLPFKYFLTLPPPLSPSHHYFHSGLCRLLISNQFPRLHLAQWNPFSKQQVHPSRTQIWTLSWFHLPRVRPKILNSAPLGHSVPSHYSLQWRSTPLFTFFFSMHYHHVAYLRAFMLVPWSKMPYPLPALSSC